MAARRPAADIAARVAELTGVRVAWCTHPAGPPVCWCRKPMPGMALVLARELGLDLSRSIHAGTGPVDRAFAERVGMTFYTVKIAAPHVKPEPNTVDRIRSPRFTLPSLRQ